MVGEVDATGMGDRPRLDQPPPAEQTHQAAVKEFRPRRRRLAQDRAEFGIGHLIGAALCQVHRRQGGVGGVVDQRAEMAGVLALAQGQGGEHRARRSGALADDTDPDVPAGPNMQQLLHQLSARLNPSAAPQYLQWIQATVGQAIQMIPVDEVLFFISDEKYTRVQTAQVEALIRKPIKELVDEVDPHLFWQIHRSTLVNVKAIAGVSRDFRGRQIVAVRGHPEKLEVSRSYTGLFKGM